MWQRVSLDRKRVSDTKEHFLDGRETAPHAQGQSYQGVIKKRLHTVYAKLGCTSYARHVGAAHPNRFAQLAGQG